VCFGKGGKNMRQEERKDFDKEAAQWDANPGRVKLAQDVADAMIREVSPAKDQDALDFGCGTGLVTLKLQPLVRSITGVDSSRGMLDVLESKVRDRKIGNVRTQFVDLEHGGTVDGRYHLIVRSMTLHHVPDPAALIAQLAAVLLPGGTLAVADLDAEDGPFHGDNTGVLHLGFDRTRVKGLLEQAGLSAVRDVTAAVVTKEIEGKGRREFPVFLIMGKK
jgi:ubiquinone/menaquinone biosynthesis C-methylase UbiE